MKQPYGTAVVNFIGVHLTWDFLAGAFTVLILWCLFGEA